MKAFDSRLCFWDGNSVQYLYILDLPLLHEGEENAPLRKQGVFD